MASEGDGELTRQQTRRAEAAAVRMLAVRSRSTEEVDRRLAEKYPAEVVEEVLRRLAEGGLLDDRAFAHQWVTERHRLKRLGRVRLARELRDLGVAKSLVEEAVASVSEEDQWQAARELAEKWAVQCRHAEGDAARRSLWDYLVRRGHPSELAGRVVGERYP